MIASGGHDRQMRPKIIEHPGAEGKSGLRQIEMGRYGNIGVQKKISALLIAYPVFKKEYVLAQQAKRLAELLSFMRHLHDGYLRVGRFCSHKHQSDIRYGA